MDAQLQRTKPMEWTLRKDDLSGSLESEDLRFRLVPETIKGGWLLIDFHTTDTDGTYPWFKHYWTKVEALNVVESAYGDNEMED
jgi:hypothetical protein